MGGLHTFTFLTYLQTNLPAKASFILPAHSEYVLPTPWNASAEISLVSIRTETGQGCEHQKIPANNLFQEKRKEMKGNNTSVCNCCLAEQETASHGRGQHHSPGRRPDAASMGSLEEPAARGHRSSTDLTHHSVHPSQSGLKWQSTCNLEEKSRARSSGLAEGTLKSQGRILNRDVTLCLPYRLQQASKYWEVYVCN